MTGWDWKGPQAWFPYLVLTSSVSVGRMCVSQKWNEPGRLDGSELSTVLAVRLRQENCREFEPNVGYVASS